MGSLATHHLIEPAQIELCMIGDSITWALKGDYWRRYLLDAIPELGFIGSHTACLGYSHAGEGGNTTSQVLARIGDLSNIPPSRNYHLLIGVNDHKASRCAEDVERVANQTFENIVSIVRQLEARPRTARIFLGTLLPCSDPIDENLMKYRDLANQAVNRRLRKDFSAIFTSGKVILIEYEQPLRQLPDWRQTIMVHPTLHGYHLITDILAAHLKKEAIREESPKGTPGVEVTNLWSDQENRSRQGIIPGCYVLSFVPEEDCDHFSLTLETLPGSTPLPFAFKRIFQKRHLKAGSRVSFTFFTGYEGYGYSKAPMGITSATCKPNQIQLEKMRPSKQASQYGTGTFVDRLSPISPGEHLVVK